MASSSMWNVEGENDDVITIMLDWEMEIFPISDHPRKAAKRW